MIGRTLTLAACVAAALTVTASSSATAGCTSGTRTIGGHPARVFCGPAKATVHIGTKTFTFTGGSCGADFGLWSVNIGTAFPGGSTSKLPYFGISVEKAKPGTYHRQTLAFRSSGVGRSSFADVTLKTLHSGTFSGKLFTGGTVSGSFTC